MEHVDILQPPLFDKSGVIKIRKQATADRDRVGTFNLWIIQTDPVPAIVYQVRHPNKSRAPGKLDVTAGGFYLAGEERADGLREVEEELGKIYAPDDITFIGRKIYVGDEVSGGRRNNVIDIGLIIDNASLETYILEAREVYAITSVPLVDLHRLHTDPNASLDIKILTADGVIEDKTITRDDFPENWDDYHFKMVSLVQRHLIGEQKLLY